MSDDQPKQRNYKAVAIAGIIISITLSVLVVAIAVNRPVLSLEPLEKPQEFVYRNQTTDQLIEIINRQSLAAYGSYPSDFAFCRDRIGESTRAAEAMNVEVDGTNVKKVILCHHENGNSMPYRIEYDTFSGEFREVVLIELDQS